MKYLVCCLIVFIVMVLVATVITFLEAFIFWQVPTFPVLDAVEMRIILAIILAVGWLLKEITE